MSRRLLLHSLAGALLAGASLSLTSGPANARTMSRLGNDDGAEAAIAEAALRFGLPTDWLHAVINAESGGYARAVSRAGAIGLMQVMPATYAELQSRYGLGADPFQVRDNVMAGAAYLRELHDRYGSVGMLAAYNAGPGRWENHLRFGFALPDETVRYLAKLASKLGVVVADLPIDGTAMATMRPITDRLFAIRPDTRGLLEATSMSVSSDGRSVQASRVQGKSTLFVAVGQSALGRHDDGPPDHIAAPASVRDANASAALHIEVRTRPTLPPGPLFIARLSSR